MRTQMNVKRDNVLAGVVHEVGQARVLEEARRIGGILTGTITDPKGATMVVEFRVSRGSAGDYRFSTRFPVIHRAHKGARVRLDVNRGTLEIVQDHKEEQPALPEKRKRA